MAEEEDKGKNSTQKLKERLAASEELNLSTEEQLKLQAQLAETLRDQNEEIIASLANKEELTEEEAEQLRLAKQNLEVQKQAIKSNKKTVEGLKQATKELERQAEIAGRLNKKIDGFANSWRGGILETILETGVSFESMAEQMKESFTITNLAGLALSTILQSTAKSFVEAANASADLAAATGTGREFLDVMVDAQDAGARFGVGFQEAAAATKALHANMADFRNMSTGMQTDIATTVASLEALGIASDGSAKQMDTAQRLLGMSASQARQSLDDQAKFAIGIGVAPAKMAADFQAAMPQLAAYGKGAEQIFKDLAVQSTGLGIEMNQLLGITQQFDTFEGAAEAAGKLNSILGGGLLDSTELLMASDQERIEILQRTVAASGKSFDQMTKFERMTIANAAGITDMSVANNLFSESSKKSAAELRQEQITQEELNEMKAKAVPIMKKLEMIMSKFAVAVGPAVEVVSSLLEGFMWFNDLLGGFPVYYLMWIGAGLTMMAIAAKGAAIATTLLGGAAPTAAGGLSAMSTAVAASGTALAAAAPGIAAFGVAALKLSIAVILIGAGIGLAAAGLALLVMAFGQLLSLIIDNITIMPQVIGSVYLLALGFQYLMLSMIMASLGMYTLGSSMLFLALIGALTLPFIVGQVLALAVAFAILTMSTQGLALMISTVFGGVALVFAIIFDGINSVADKIMSTMEALQNFSGDGFVTAMEVVQNVTSENVDNISEVMDQAERYVQVQAQMKVLGAVDAFTTALGNVMSPASDTATTNSQREVILKLDDREFARAVTEALDGKMKLNLMGA